MSANKKKTSGPDNLNTGKVDVDQLSDSQTMQTVFGASVKTAYDLAVTICADKEFSKIAGDAGMWFMYDGFNAQKIAALILKRAAAAGLGKDETKNYIIYMCTLGMTRGTKTDKILKKTGSDGQVIIKKIIEIFKIEGKTANKNAQDVGADTITIGRVMAAFPLICAQLLVANVVEPSIPVDTSGELTGLPVYYQFNTGASIIPTDDSKMYDLWIKWALKVDKVINGANADEARVKKYAKVMHDSPVVENGQRKIIAGNLSSKSSVV